jgi:IS4 transposase
MIIVCGEEGRRRAPLASFPLCLIIIIVKVFDSLNVKPKSLIEIKVGKTSYSYITSVLDPQILPPYAVADLYRRRWRIEEAFHTVKRLLRLSYLWTGSINGVKFSRSKTFVS